MFKDIQDVVQQVQPIPRDVTYLTKHVKAKAGDFILYLMSIEERPQLQSTPLNSYKNVGKFQIYNHMKIYRNIELEITSMELIRITFSRILIFD